jgi:hypothetical protein
VLPLLSRACENVWLVNASLFEYLADVSARVAKHLTVLDFLYKSDNKMLPLSQCKTSITLTFDEQLAEVISSSWNSSNAKITLSYVQQICKSKFDVWKQKQKELFLLFYLA